MVIALVALISLQGCSTVKSWVPSFWDDNQSRAIIDVRQSVRQIDCDQPQQAQAQRLLTAIEWFELYSDSKGWRQQDVLRVVKPMRETAEDWHKRTQDQQASKTYCTLKKQVLVRQSDAAAKAVLGRF
jgi:flagellar basal body L-ring protein FlgH